MAGRSLGRSPSRDSNQSVTQFCRRQVAIHRTNLLGCRARLLFIGPVVGSWQAKRAASPDPLRSGTPPHSMKLRQAAPVTSTEATWSSIRRRDGPEHAARYLVRSDQRLPVPSKELGLGDERGRRLPSEGTSA